MISQAAMASVTRTDETRKLAAVAAGVSLHDPQDVAAGTAASVVINRYPYRTYNRNRHEWNADGRGSPTLIPAD